MKSVPLFLCLSLMATAAMAEDKKYTLEDLNALIEQEEWGEFLSHAKDVAPGKRKGQWKTNVEKAAIGALDDAVKQGPIQAFSFANNLGQQFKTLKKSKPYMKHRGEVGLASLKGCFAQRYSVGCYDVLKLFVEGDPKNVELNYQAGKMARLNMNHRAAVPFMARAVKHAKGKKKSEICKDEDTALAVVNAFNAPKSDNTKMAKELFKGACYKALKKPVFEEFLEGSSYVAEHTCDIFKKKKALSTFQKAHCKDKGGK